MSLATKNTQDSAGRDALLRMIYDGLRTGSLNLSDLYACGERSHDGPATDAEISTAIAIHGTRGDGTISIDAGAWSSRGEDGVWVHAWLFVPHGADREVA